MDTEKLIKELKADEGEVIKNGRHVAYEDHLGFLTIGYGRLIDARRGGGLTTAEAHYLLVNDINARHAVLREKLPFWSKLSDDRQRALINMSFQLGINGLMRFKKMILALEVGDYAKAAAEALDSNWARIQTPDRARRMAAMILHG